MRRDRGRAAGEPPRWLNEEQLLVHRDPAVLVDDDESAVRRLQRIAGCPDARQASRSRPGRQHPLRNRDRQVGRLLERHLAGIRLESDVLGERNHPRRRPAGHLRQQLCRRRRELRHLQHETHALAQRRLAGSTLEPPMTARPSGFECPLSHQNIGDALLHQVGAWVNRTGIAAGRRRESARSCSSGSPARPRLETGWVVDTGCPQSRSVAGLMLARFDPRRSRSRWRIWSSGTAALTAPAPSGRRTLVGLESEPIGTRSAGA